MAKIFKQISKIKYPEVISLLKLYIDKYQNFDIENKLKRFGEIISEQNPKLYTELQNVNSELILYFTNIMDLYLLGRLFKTFSKTSKNNLFNQNDAAKRIVIYVGDAHANNYRKFLEKLGFKLSFGTPMLYQNYNTISELIMLKEKSSELIKKNVLDIKESDIYHIFKIIQDTRAKEFITKYLHNLSRKKKLFSRELNLTYVNKIQELYDKIFIEFIQRQTKNILPDHCLNIRNLNNDFFWSIYD